MFQPLPSRISISFAKQVFNFVSYSTLVSETHDFCHCQAKKNFFSIKRQCSARSLSASQRRTCFIPSFVFTLSFELFCCSLTFKNRVSYIQDGLTATLQMLHFIFFYSTTISTEYLNPLKPELNPICYLLALLGTHHFLHVSRIRVKLLTFRLLMSYI